jgi:porin
VGLQTPSQRVPVGIVGFFHFAFPNGKSLSQGSSTFMKSAYQRVSLLTAVLAFFLANPPVIRAGQSVGDVNAAASPSTTSWFQSLLSADHFLGGVPGRQQLSDSNGITFNGQLINDMLWNTVGGLKAGNADAGLLQFGLDADLKKLIGWDGGTFHTSWLYTYGVDLENYIGGNLSPSSVATQMPSFRCYELWYQQAFLNNLINIRGGLLAIDTEFTLSYTAALFVNELFGLANIATFNLANGGPQYPMSTPGIRLEIDPTDWLMLHTVFSQANPFSQEQNQHNFSWNFGPSGGLLNMTEGVVKWKSVLKSRLPGTAKLGYWIQNGPTPTLPQNYSQIGSPQNVMYSTGFYGVIDQALYRVHHSSPGDTQLTDAEDSVVPMPAENSPQGLDAYWRMGYTPQPNNPVTLFMDTGLVYTGLIPGRKNDRIGIAFAYGQISTGYRNLAAQDNVPGAGYGGVVECTYSIQLTPAITLQPDLQYIFHPSGTQQYGNSLVAGFRATVVF